MGFFDSLFGTKKPEKTETPTRQYVNIDAIINATEKKGVNVTGETGGFGNYIYVKPIDLDSDVDVDAGKNELLRGNLVIFDLRHIIVNKALTSTLTSNIKKIVEDIHGDVRRIAEDKILAVPAGYKFMERPPAKEE